MCSLQRMHSDTYRRQYRQQFYKIIEETGIDSVPVEQFKQRLSRQKGSLKLKAEQIDLLMNVADKNGDERITVEEFENLVTSRQAQSSKIRRALYAVADQIITPSQQVDVHSYIDEYTLCPPPVFILFISIIEFAVFLFYYFAYPPVSTSRDFWTYCAGCFVRGKPGPLIFAPSLKEQAWRFGSYALLHAGFTHLITNLIMQLLVGIPLEVVHKMWRIGPLYLAAVVSGALLQYSLDPTAMLVGASGGVYCLITAHLANVIINWSEMPFRWVRIAILAVFLVFDIGGTIFRRLFTDECDTISHAAHFAGGLTGFCFGVCILYNIVDHFWEKVIRYLCLAAYALFIVVTVLLVIFMDPKKPIWVATACDT